MLVEESSTVNKMDKNVGDRKIFNQHEKKSYVSNILNIMLVER